MTWMNERALGKTPYQPTDVEHWANMVTHGIFVVPAIFSTKSLIDASHSEIKKWAAAIYGLALIGLFSVSTIFHVFFYFFGHYKNLKELLHRSDRAMIYIFIASSYTPWLLLKPVPIESWVVHLRWGVWVLALAGIIYQQMFHERFKMLETIFYVIIASLPFVAVASTEDYSGLHELEVGGGLYILGVVFFKMDGRIPLAHAIWHLFVVLASFIHYYAVLNYLILPSDIDHALSGTHGDSPGANVCDTSVMQCQA